MTVLSLVKECVECGRGIRPKKSHATDFPGLMAAGNRGECSACTTRRTRILRKERRAMGASYGRSALPGYVPEPPVRECCIKCRRGTKQHGVLPCGYALNCPNGCHRREP